jgi:hypothetical protein
MVSCLWRSTLTHSFLNPGGYVKDWELGEERKEAKKLNEVYMANFHYVKMKGNAEVDSDWGARCFCDASQSP